MPETTETEIDIDGQTLSVWKAGGMTRYYNEKGQLHRLGGPAFIGRAIINEHWIEDAYQTPIRHAIEVLIRTGTPTPEKLASFFKEKEGLEHAKIIIDYMIRLKFPNEEIKRLYTNACAYWQLEFGCCPDENLPETAYARKLR